jgi:hypothetical protein
MVSDAEAPDGGCKSVPTDAFMDDGVSNLASVSEEEDDDSDGTASSQSKSGAGVTTSALREGNGGVTEPPRVDDSVSSLCATDLDADVTDGGCECEPTNVFMLVDFDAGR